MNYRGDTCRSCGAPIIWVKTEAGKNAPIDRDATDDGNTVIVKIEGRTIHTRVLHKGEETEALLYSNHFATCPDAKEHRRSE